MAEIIHTYHPHLIDLHSYINSTSSKVKTSNWELLKKKAFKKIAYTPSDELIKQVIECKYFAIETLLIPLKEKLENSHVDKPSFRLNTRNQNGNTTVITENSRDENVKYQFELKTFESTHQVELNELKNTLNRLQLKVDKLNGVIVSKDIEIRAMESKLNEHGLKY